MLHVDGIGAKPPIHRKIVKTHLDQTTSDLQSAIVGHFICVQQSTFNLQEGPPIPLFGGLGAFLNIATAVPGVRASKQSAYVNFVKPYQIFDLTL